MLVLMCAVRLANKGVGRVTAVLGPTNTGKTHFAIERMLAHKTGMIGLPLRLLAREVYDKVVRLKGQHQAALITGEEKIVPPHARYFVCTVEAMPVDIGVACLVVDEVQLATDPERGHVFTDRLLHAKGEEETIFLGSDTMRGPIQRFVPNAYFMSRARFSDLAYTGTKKLSRLPRRSVVVAFSAEDVYGMAELIRRHRGGAAVVLGALSPRTRNAQVGLYQSGDVDFLVATDAIGMGLNMDVDHVAFSSLEKFDGIGVRPLKPEEVGQIAGRAGRHMNDGTFGVTADASVLDEEVVARVEGHRYDPVRLLQWRNSQLEFQSLDHLIETLEAPPPAKGLARARPSSDLVAAKALAKSDEIRAIAGSRPAVHRLWEACQLPDFRKLSMDDHVHLVETIFRHLMSDDGVLPDAWLERAVARLDQTEGDVATLSGRLAQIRTWTYAAHRSGWVKDGDYWQALTRAIEDRLSDALHERLTQRFVDRRTSVLMRRLRQDDDIALMIDDSGGVAIDGVSVGKLDGFRFVADDEADGIHGRTLRAATMRGLDGELYARARRLSEAKDTDIQLSEHGKLWWDGAIVGRLEKGPSPLSPRVSLVADDQVKGIARDWIASRLENWLAQRLSTVLETLFALKRATEAKSGSPDALAPAARGVAHQLCDQLGSLDRAAVLLPADIGPLIRSLRPYGVWFGRRSIFLPRLLRPDAAGLLALLWGVDAKLENLPAPPRPGLTSFAYDVAVPLAFLAAAGFRVLAGRAVRLDMLERVENELAHAAEGGAGARTLMPKLASLLGCDNETVGRVLGELGWRLVAVTDRPEDEPVWRLSRSRRRERDQGPKHAVRESPFAELASLIAAR